MSSELTENRLRFARLVTAPEPALDLARACLLIAAEADPDVPFQPTLEQLDELAARVAARDSGAPGLESRLDVLHGVLYGEFGLRGDQTDYYDPRNAFLHEVLTRRLGIPITLAVIELEVAWRVGLPLHGIGFPGHFLVGGPHGLVIDPFARGRRLGRDALEELLLGGRPAQRSDRVLPAPLLRPATKREILARILYNLRAMYMRRHAWTDALWTFDLLAILHPDDRELSRDRALVLGRTGRFRAASQALERYLAEQPGAADADAVRRALAGFRARLN